MGSIPVPGTSYASQKSYTVSLQGQWHLDLWGEHAGLEDSAMRQVWRAAYEYENTKRNLIANLASAYVSYQSTSDALRLARDSEAVGQAVVDTMEARIKAGDATLDELEQKRGVQHVPPVDLSAQNGLSAATLAQMLQPTSFFWNAIAGVIVNIFDGGRKELDKAYAESYYREMVETYAKTVLQAVREVEGALTSLRSSRARLAAQQGAVQDGLKQYHLSQAAFRLVQTRRRVCAIPSRRPLSHRRSGRPPGRDYRRARFQRDRRCSAGSRRIAGHPTS